MNPFTMTMMTSLIELLEDDHRRRIHVKRDGERGNGIGVKTVHPFASNNSHIHFHGHIEKEKAHILYTQTTKETSSSPLPPTNTQGQKVILPNPHPIPSPPAHSLQNSPTLPRRRSRRTSNPIKQPSNKTQPRNLLLHQTRKSATSHTSQNSRHLIQSGQTSHRGQTLAFD